MFQKQGNRKYLEELQFHRNLIGHLCRHLMRNHLPIIHCIFRMLRNHAMHFVETFCCQRIIQCEIYVYFFIDIVDYNHLWPKLSIFIVIIRNFRKYFLQIFVCYFFKLSRGYRAFFRCAYTLQLFQDEDLQRSRRWFTDHGSVLKRSKPYYFEIYFGFSKKFFQELLFYFVICGHCYCQRFSNTVLKINNIQNLQKIQEIAWNEDSCYANIQGISFAIVIFFIIRIVLWSHWII